MKKTIRKGVTSISLTAISLTKVIPNPREVWKRKATVWSFIGGAILKWFLKENNIYKATSVYRVTS